MTKKKMITSKIEYCAKSFNVPELSTLNLYSVKLKQENRPRKKKVIYIYLNKTNNFLFFISFLLAFLLLWLSSSIYLLGHDV
jgi:hypothetical protein